MTSSATPSPDDQTPKRSILAYHRPRGLLTIACLACFAVSWWIAAALGIPEELYHDPSLATQSGAVVTFLAGGITLVACTLIGTLIAGTVRADAGFFAACIGLSAWAIRFGTAGQALREAESAGIFLWLAVETVLFCAWLAAAWALQVWLGRLGLAVRDAVRDGMEPQVLPLGARLLAAGTHVAATCLLLMVLLRSDDKAQALASVGLASLLASLVAHTMFGIVPSVWMWAGPLVAGVIGYLVGFGAPGPAWQTGHPTSALARAIPLDYITAGPAGALIGYWMSRKWHAARQHDARSRKTAIAAPGTAPRG